MPDIIWGGKPGEFDLCETCNRIVARIKGILKQKLSGTGNVTITMDSILFWGQNERFLFPNLDNTSLTADEYEGV